MTQTTEETQTFSEDAVREAHEWTPWLQQWFREPSPREAMRAAHNEVARGEWTRRVALPA